MKTLAFTGGGTGGHLAIVRAVIKELDSERLIYIGSTKGQDRDWFENEDRFSSKYFLETSGVMDKKGVLGKLSSLTNILNRVKEAREILKKEDVKVLFSVGGFSAAPASIAAITLGIPLVIHEQNAYTGTLNRVLKPFAKAFISSYEENPVTKSYPVDSIFFELSRVRREVKSILISGGSQGSVALNRFALEVAPKLDKMGIKIYHQAGVKSLAEVKEEYKKLGIDAKVFGFTKEMPQIVAKADFAVSRAGASTLWEMVANGLPALFVPYPYAANDHQYYNAKFLVDRGVGCLVREDKLNQEIFFQALKDCNIEEVSSKLIKTLSPNGAKEIANYLKNLID
jgi:UDP-N-acetylglucosamine--N-acetylmuramyl-(pentapeptide) pyrophosphoryl-undecaprenol N-acetylglucosamine transferase